MSLRRRVHLNEGGGGGEGGGGDGGGGERAVEDRVDEELDRRGLIAQVKDLRHQRRGLQAKIGTLEAAMVEREASAGEITAQLEAEKAGRAADLASWQDEGAMLSAGLVDTKGQAVARTLYSVEPEETRPASFKEFVASWSAEGGAVPPGVAPYLAVGAGNGGGGPPTPAPPRRETPGASGRVSDAALREARLSGNHVKLRELLGALAPPPL